MSSPPLILFSIIVFCFLAFIIIMSCVSDRSAMNKSRQRSAWIERFRDRLNDPASFAVDVLSQLRGGNVKLKALTSFFQIAQTIGVSFFLS